MLIPAVGVYVDATGTMEDRSVVYQRIPAHSAIHLLTSYDTGHENLALSKGQIQTLALGSPHDKKAKGISYWRSISSLHIELLIIAC